MGTFKLSAWDDENTSNDACSTFVKGQESAKNISKTLDKKLKSKSKKAGRKKVKKKGIDKGKSSPILKAKVKSKIKKLKDDKNKLEKANKKAQIKPQSTDKEHDDLPPVVFNRRTINNPILSSRKQNKDKSLRERMMERLHAARFRFLNEEIYVQDGKNVEKMFKNDPGAFSTYHTGYRQQVDKWPVNPLDVIIQDVKKMSKNLVIADLGCGDAKLAKSVEQKVHSFDLVALNDTVTVCNMAATPLAVNSVDVVVFCLSLMGTNLHDYVREANRILKIGGLLKIAEVESRFDEVTTFVKGVEHFGFKKIKMDFSHNLFYFFDFKKSSKCKVGAKQSTLMLKPCLYKKR